MSEPYFSVIIPTYNRCALLEQCLESIAAQDFSSDLFEVIIVDDGSTDDTEEFCRSVSYTFDCHYVRVANGGPSMARNAGAKMARGEMLAFTEDDVRVSSDWLLNAREHLLDNSLDILEGATLDQQSKRAVRRFETKLRHSFIPCNLFVRRSIYEKLGGYDRAFFDAKTKLYFREDADFGFRALDIGARTLVSTDVIVEHPQQFTHAKSAWRHVRRYIFDPLLFKKHPQRYREMIEVKDIGWFTVRRVTHYLALLYGAGVIGFLALLIKGVSLSYVFLALALFCSFAYRFKYRGRKAIEVFRLGETLMFLILPAVYLIVIIRGCIRFRSFGVLR